jgi:predicted ATP-dependent endonuclease of OLD family
MKVEKELMMSNFECNDVQEAIDNFNGYARISYNVKGYWSHDVITVYVQRNWCVDEEGYEYTISNSSGGRDQKQVALDEDAILNFAGALVHAAETIKYIRTQEHRLTEAYNKYTKMLREAEEAVRRKKEEKKEADARIGKYRAEVLTKQAIELAAAKGKATILARVRGEEYKLAFVVNYGMRASFTMPGNYGKVRASRKDFIAALSEMSTDLEIV